MISETSKAFVGDAHLTGKDIFLSLVAHLPSKVPAFALIGAIVGLILGGAQMIGSLNAFVFFGTIAYMTAFMSLFAIIMVPINTLICMIRLSSEQKHCTYTLDGTGHKIADQSGMTLSIVWQQIEWAKIGNQAILLKVKKVGSRWIPLRAYSPEQVAALPEFLAEHTLLK